MNQTPERDAHAERGLLPQDETQRALLLEAYSSQQIAASVLFTLIGTMVVLGTAWVSGTAAGIRPASVWIALLLIALQAPLLHLSRWALVGNDETRFSVSYFLAAQAQFSWALWLGFFGGPFAQPIVIMVICLWMFSDIRLIDERLLRPTYMAMFPVFDAWFLVAVGVGGDAVYHLPEPDQVAGYAAATLVTQGLAAMVIYAVIGLLVEQQSRGRELEARHEETVRRLDRERAEKALLYNMSHLLGRGLALSWFWHDARNAVQAVVLDGPFLRDTFEPHLDTLLADEDERAEVAMALRHVAETSASLAMMLKEVKRTMGGAEKLEAVSPRELVEGALTFMRSELALREQEPPEVRLQIEDDVHLWVPESQVRALGNIIVNGAVRTKAPMTIRGAPEQDDLYAFEIEDRGVDGAERALGLRRIRASLELHDPHEGAVPVVDDGAQGFGMGLMFAKVQVVGRGGEIDVRANDDGPGVTFRVVLRRPYGAPEAT